MLRRSIASKFALQYNLDLTQILIRFHCMALDLITTSASASSALRCFFSSNHVTPYFMELENFLWVGFLEEFIMQLGFPQADLLSMRMFLYWSQIFRNTDTFFVCFTGPFAMSRIITFGNFPLQGHGQALVVAIRIYEYIRIT